MIRRHDALGADEDTGPVGPVAVFAFLFLLAASPLMRGGNRHVALIVLEGAALERVNLLILDDWGPEPLTADQRRDLLEIVDDR